MKELLFTKVPAPAVLTSLLVLALQGTLLTLYLACPNIPQLVENASVVGIIA